MNGIALTASELVASLQNEVRILLHLAGKVDRNQLDYRPTPKQRSTIELLRYLSVMGPALIPAIKAGKFEPAAFGAAMATANAMDFNQVMAAIEKESSVYAELVGGFTEEELRGDVALFGPPSSRGSMIVNMVLSGHAAYRTQLFLYLKACGREELSTMNLWGGMDAPVPA
ncbi:MAG TPA: hypothetical protein VGH38_26750 [Bryobacteraceae bacterium]